MTKVNKSLLDNRDIYIAWIIANLLDLLTTIYAITVLGFLEYNPLAGMVISTSILLFIALKLLVTMSAFILPRKVLIFFTFWCYGIVLWNSYLIFSII